MTATEKIPHTVSFVVPALDEEAVVETIVRDISATVDALIATYEIILIDDGSCDRTGAIMDDLARQLPHTRVIHNKPNIGLGACYRLGVGEAKLDYVMMLCGDGGLPAASLPAIVARIGTADIVVPWMVNLRAIKTPARYLLSRTYTTVMNVLSGRRLRYYNGLPVHRRALLQRIEITSSGFGFQGEILVKLMKSGCSFVEVGVNGAEATNKSSALGLKNVASVSRTVIKLVRELSRFRPAEWRSDRRAEIR